MTRIPRHRVRAVTVAISRGPDGQLVAQAPGRGALTVVEQLAKQDRLGDEVVPLLAAARWFGDLAHDAGMRGRLAQSSLTAQAPNPNWAARQRMIACCAAIGNDAFNILVDTMVWEQMIAPERAPLLRTALKAVIAFRRTLALEAMLARQAIGTKKAP